MGNGFAGLLKFCLKFYLTLVNFVQNNCSDMTQKLDFSHKLMCVQFPKLPIIPVVAQEELFSQSQRSNKSWTPPPVSCTPS